MSQSEPRGPAPVPERDPLLTLAQSISNLRSALSGMDLRLAELREQRSAGLEEANLIVAQAQNRREEALEKARRVGKKPNTKKADKLLSRAVTLRRQLEGAASIIDRGLPAWEAQRQEAQLELDRAVTRYKQATGKLGCRTIGDGAEPPPR